MSFRKIINYAFMSGIALALILMAASAFAEAPDSGCYRIGDDCVDSLELKRIEASKQSSEKADERVCDVAHPCGPYGSCQQMLSEVNRLSRYATDTELIAAEHPTLILQRGKNITELLQAEIGKIYQQYVREGCEE